MNNSKSFSDLFDEWIIEKGKEKEDEEVYNAINNLENKNLKAKVYTKPSSFSYSDGIKETIIYEEVIIDMEVGFSSLNEFFNYLRRR